MIQTILKGCLRNLLVSAGFAAACYATSGTVQTPNQASVTYSGPDGTIEYDWAAPMPGSVNSLGTVHIKAHLGNLPQTDIQLNPTLFPAPIPTSVPAYTPIVFQSAQWSSNSAGASWNLSYQAGSLPLTVTLQLALSGRLLSVLCSASQPILNAIDIGQWPAASMPKSIPIPYYAGNPPVYLQSQNLFATAYYDWRSSSATSFSASGTQAVYSPLTNGIFNKVSDRLLIGVSSNLSDLFPDMGNAPSPYLSELSGKLTVDIWTPLGFDDVSKSLKRLSNYGLKDCVVLLHGWQSFGFDNALPAHTPANPGLGGDMALSNLVRTTQSFGCRFGLHENYVDYYPDYPGFTKSAIALWSDSSTENAWFNQTTGIQSFVTKPTQILSNAKLQSPLIKNTFAVNSSFIDVNSSAPPWWRADMDASAPGAGQFATYKNESIALWKYARDLYQGPVFGEGANHAFWSGLLDGAEAQLGAGGVPGNIGGQAPLLVDFDLAKIHPLQVNQGMGYYERWITPGDNIRNPNAMDAYRMQEIIFGHAPFLTGNLWADPASMIVEQNLIGSVAQRYGTQTVSSTQYQFKGNWTDLSTASKGGAWNRVQVHYSNGDVIVANSTQQAMTWQGYTLPAYGWMATGHGLLAYTAQKNGVVADYAETANSIFANARNQKDIQLSGALAQPSTVDFTQPAQGRFRFSLNWKVLDYAQIDQYNGFVQFVSPTSPNPEGIVLQCGHPPPFSNDAWQPGAVLADSYECPLPESVPDGVYAVSVGLYSWATGERQTLGGLNDGRNRFVTGTLTIKNGGTVIAFTPQAPIPQTPDPRLNGSGTTVDFNAVKTDGMVSFLNDGTAWTLRSYPVSRNVVIQVAGSHISQPSTSALRCDSPRTPPTVTDLGNGYWQIQMNGAKSCSW